VELIEKVLGKTHPDTIASLYNAAQNQKELGNLSEAEALFRQELERCEKVYGPEHSKTLGSRRNLASFLERQGRTAEAETFWSISQSEADSEGTESP
jgi:Tetratricopeptide repeat